MQICDKFDVFFQKSRTASHQTIKLNVFSLRKHLILLYTSLCTVLYTMVNITQDQFFLIFMFSFDEIFSKHENVLRLFQHVLCLSTSDCIKKNI